MPVQCDVCSRFFKTPETLAKHKEFHSRQQKKVDDNTKKRSLVVEDPKLEQPPLKRPQTLPIGQQDNVQVVEETKPAPPRRFPAVRITDNNNELVFVQKKLPFVLTVNRLRPYLSPLSMWLCARCIETSSNRLPIIFKDSSRAFVTISMCKECLQGNSEMQQVISDRWTKYFESKKQDESKKEDEVNKGEQPDQ